MVKCTSVFTCEVDDHEKALNEIQAQLEQKLTLLENTVGVIMCHTEFINTGVLEYIGKNIPFDLVGATTASLAVNEEISELMLTIFVITSDEVKFRTGITQCLNDDISGPTRAAYNKASAGMEEQPKLALIFPPLITKYAGDAYIIAWEELIPHTPLFGSIAIDDTISFDGSVSIYNGLTYRTAMPFIICYGNITPRFVVGTLPESNLMPYRGEITKSKGSFVYEINNVNAFQYFEDLGLINKQAKNESFRFIAFMIDLMKRKDYDGIQIMRGLAEFTNDGTAIFRGNMDENSVFSLSRLTPEDAISTTLEKVDEINQMTDVNGVLSFSCIVRRMTMGTTPLLELKNYTSRITGEFPYLIGYAGGEICPTSIRDGIPANRFHNYTFISLVI